MVMPIKLWRFKWSGIGIVVINELGELGEVSFENVGGRLVRLDELWNVEERSRMLEMGEFGEPSFRMLKFG